jgi:hypothetical protein
MPRGLSPAKKAAALRQLIADIDAGRVEIGGKGHTAASTRRRLRKELEQLEGRVRAQSD